MSEETTAAPKLPVTTPEGLFESTEIQQQLAEGAFRYTYDIVGQADYPRSVTAKAELKAKLGDSGLRTSFLDQAPEALVRLTDAVREYLRTDFRADLKLQGEANRTEAEANARQKAMIEAEVEGRKGSGELRFGPVESGDHDREFKQVIDHPERMKEVYDYTIQGKRLADSRGPITEEALVVTAAVETLMSMAAYDCLASDYVRKKNLPMASAQDIVRPSSSSTEPHAEAWQGTERTARLLEAQRVVGGAAGQLWRGEKTIYDPVTMRAAMGRVVKNAFGKTAEVLEQYRSLATVETAAAEQERMEARKIAWRPRHMPSGVTLRSGRKRVYSDSDGNNSQQGGEAGKKEPEVPAVPEPLSESPLSPLSGAEGKSGAGNHGHQSGKEFLQSVATEQPPEPPETEPQALEGLLPSKPVIRRLSDRFTIRGTGKSQ